MSKLATAERVSRDPSDNFVYQRSRLAYYFAAERVGGESSEVLEIGTGTGYGVDIIAPYVKTFTTLDKAHSPLDTERIPANVQMIRASVPPIPFGEESFDHIVSFQVIEHIRKDDCFVEEIHRVLRNGGTAIISTPNVRMSLTRNPWHVREYTIEQFEQLLKRHNLEIVERKGVVGNSRVMQYYEKNRESVRRITRFDIFRLQHILPRWLLKLPYDVMNRMNRRKLLDENTQLTNSIKMEDYSVEEVSDRAFDLLYVVRKR